MSPATRAAAPAARRTSPLVFVLCALLMLAMPAAIAAPPSLAEPAAAPVEAAPALDADVDVRGRFDAVYDEVRDRTVRLIAHLPLLFAAVVIVLLAARLGRLVSQRLHWLRLRTRNPYLDGLMRRIVHGVILIAGVLIALDLLNATALVGALLGSAGVLGLALGFAFKDIAENYIAGILLSLRRPFAPGDTVRIDSFEGKVAALSARDMVLVTMDGNELRLPNALVFKAVLLNFTSNPRRRFEFTFNIDAGQSIRKAQEIAVAEIAGIDGVLTEPAPSWTVVEFGSGGTVLRFFGWIDQRQSDLGKTRSEAIRLVKGAFWRAGIETPRTTNHVVLSRAADDDAPPHRVDVEPATSIGVDTSVNRDIDLQVAEVQNSDQNLLNPKEPTS